MNVPQVMLEDILEFLHNIWGIVKAKKEKKFHFRGRSNGSAMRVREIENVKSLYKNSDEQRI